ncbi:hypothetical protein DESC_610297 [Desulfosarcina cetonica]|uniref:hypothetical protein n=1 Tax=Desulfosarcina cetonica TaxID=90730 RepID=UPI0012EDE545|nr:hypothetical protein [Desulfosarcina cetonica]VTR67714.1 hypothetical protein DESC_610297 [Desulfosarcina cetonica]
MKKILYTILVLVILLVSCSEQPRRGVDLSTLNNAVKIEVKAFESTGTRTVTIFQKASEIESICHLLEKENLKVDSNRFDMSPPNNSAHFRNSDGKTIFIVWFGNNWIGSQNESKSQGTEYWELDDSKMNYMRSLFKLKEL